MKSRELLFEYRGDTYPTYLRDGKAIEFIIPAAKHFCRGDGLDIGGGKWPFPGARCVDISNGGDAMALPEGRFDYIISSHCLEHLPNPVAALEHWRTRLKPGCPLFLYLPHPDQLYWRPQYNRRHLHSWQPEVMVRLLQDMGFESVIASGRDMHWSFAVVAFVKGDVQDAPFRYLVEESSDHLHNDPLLGDVFKTFGADAFRRSSAAEPQFETIIKRCGFRGKRCVEIGTYNGMTALVLSRHFDEVVTFDIFPHTAKHTIADHFGIKNIRFVDVKDNAEKAALISELDFDAAYVDGDHAKDAESDFALVARCGRVLFHEYWEQQRPVLDLVNRLMSAGKVEVEGKFALWTATS